jgi:hypothetical protein
VKQRRIIVSDEHQKIRQDYLKNATRIKTQMEGLAGWWDGDRAKMWDQLVAQQKQPSEVIDSYKSLINAALKRTTG